MTTIYEMTIATTVEKEQDLSSDLYKNSVVLYHHW